MSNTISSEAIRDFIAASVECLDDDRLEDWTTYFTEDATYRILSRENSDRNLPLSLLTCEGLDMIQDRVTSLRNANIYNIHWDCHILGRTLVKNASGSEIDAVTSYSLYQTTQEGISFLFSVGRYKDKIRINSGELKISERIVISDTGAIKSNLSTPI